MQKMTARPRTCTQKKKTAEVPNRELIITAFVFLISRAGMFGVATPLGISALAVTQRKGMWGWLHLFSAVCGMMSSGLGFMYVPSAIVFFLVTYFEKGYSCKNRLMTAIYACGSVTMAGLPQVLWLGGYMTDILRLVLCALISFFAVFVFSAALSVFPEGGKRRYLQQDEAVSLALTVSIAALGLPQGAIGFVTPGNVISAFLVMTFALSGKCTVSASAGIVCGFVLGNKSPEVFSFMGTLGFCGLLSGLFSGAGKAGIGSAFVVGHLINACFAGVLSKITLPIIDVSIAILTFAAVPKRLASSLGIMKALPDFGDECVRFRDAMRDKLSFISEGFSQLSSSISFFGGKKGFDKFSMYEKASDEICRDCALSSLCWQKHYNDTYETMMRCFREIERNGSVEIGFLPEFFRERCEDCEGFIKSINRAYEEFKSELVWQDRLSKSNELSAGRFSEAARVVEQLCDNIDKNITFNEELAKAVSAALDARGIAVESAAVFKNPYGRYEVRLKTASCGGVGRCTKMASVISEILERSVEKTKGDCMLKSCSLTFTESGMYSIEHSVRGISAPGEDVSGDCATAYTMPDGNVLLAISDGRGVGPEANLMSCETIRLLSRLMNAGFSSDAAARLANAAMSAKCDDEQFATVDIAVINTVNGSGIFVKSGACSTYVYRNGVLHSIKCDSLPAGVGVEFECSEKYFQLKEEDIVIMMSDGIYESFNKESELKSEILSLCKGENPDTITSRLINSARSGRIREDDDMTVIAARVKVK